MSDGGGAVPHDPVEFANALGVKMASASRHLCLFLGAGVSKACGLPDVGELQQKVLDGLDSDHRAAFDIQLDGRNLEQALSRLRRIAALIEGDEQLDGLSKESATDLDQAVCRQVVDALDTAEADTTPMLRLAGWLGRARYNLPVEVFSVNYDPLLELGLEAMKIPYFDGFVGNLRARFRADLVEGNRERPEQWLPPFMVRLWKLHGSVNWAWVEDDSSKVVRLGAPVPDGDAAAIYPSDAKYDESRRVPFLVLHDRFRAALSEPESLVLVSGYSFSDQHLNETLFEAAEAHPRSEICCFCFDEIPEPLVARAVETPNLQALSPKRAIISCLDGGWANPTDETPKEIWDDDSFGLGDFGALARFLTRSSPSQRILEARLEALLTAAGANDGT
jgi:SIR2-like protein